MARLERTRTNDKVPDGNYNNAPDPRVVIVHGLIEWMGKRGHHSLPAPCPPDPDLCAMWWMEQMQESEQVGETRIAALLGPDNGTRWEEGYACRCRNSLLRFLDMPINERKAIVAGVTGDKVPYRGDSYKQYLDIYEEVMDMRKDRKAYIRDALTNAKRRLTGMFGGEKA